MQWRAEEGSTGLLLGGDRSGRFSRARHLTSTDMSALGVLEWALAFKGHRLKPFIKLLFEEDAR